MRPLGETAAGTILGAGFLAASAISASAAIACAGQVCWHTHETYADPRESRLVVPRTIGAGAASDSPSASTKGAAIGAAATG
ncbi:Mn2+/Fe2+ NRAMP family transporter [Bradyrhizobium elkanii]|nr:Mn2+/Fe2+ NRAMP family transporter [Bradyrhizobium elkanii]